MGHVEMKLEILYTVKYLDISNMFCSDGNQHAIGVKPTWTQLDHPCVRIKNVGVLRQR